MTTLSNGVVELVTTCQHCGTKRAEYHPPEIAIRVNTIPLTASFALPARQCNPVSHSSSSPAPLNHCSRRSCGLRDSFTAYLRDLDRQLAPDSMME